MKASQLKIGDTVTGPDGYEWIFIPNEYVNPVEGSEPTSSFHVYITRATGWGNCIYIGLEPEWEVDLMKVPDRKRILRDRNEDFDAVMDLWDELYVG